MKIIKILIVAMLFVGTSYCSESSEKMEEKQTRGSTFKLHCYDQDGLKQVEGIRRSFHELKTLAVDRQEAIDEEDDDSVGFNAGMDMQERIAESEETVLMELRGAMKEFGIIEQMTDRLIGIVRSGKPLNLVTIFHEEVRDLDDR